MPLYSLNTVTTKESKFRSIEGTSHLPSPEEVYKDQIGSRANTCIYLDCPCNNEYELVGVYVTDGRNVYIGLVCTLMDKHIDRDFHPVKANRHISCVGSLNEVSKRIEICKYIETLEYNTLRKECSRLGLGGSGSKDELIHKLKDYYVYTS